MQVDARSLMRRLAILAIVAACGGGGTRPPARAVPAPPAATPDPPPDDLSAQLEPIRAAEHLPALGMAVWRGGALVAIGITGVRKDGDSTPATVDDQWHLGSDTKAMTATLIGIYVDRGVLHWDDTIAALFPDTTIDPGYANVTLDQLLAHRGGAPGKPPLDLVLAMMAGRTTAEPAAARAAFVASVLARPPAQSPGTFEYANAGYMIAAAALERATGKTWDDLIAAELFTPLGMTSCGLGAPGTPGAIDQPWGHESHTVDGAVTLTPLAPGDPDADNPPAMGPAGAVHCSMRDWGKFLVLHAGTTQSLVSAATFAHLHQPMAGDGQRYGGGWIMTTLPGGVEVLGHEGSNTKWHAIAIVVPSLDTAIAIVANRADLALTPAMLPLMAPYLKPR